MKTYIEELKTIFPNIVYDDGQLFLDNEDWIENVPLSINDKPLNADSLISEYFDDWEIFDNPNEDDPVKEKMAQVNGHSYIKHRFDGDYKEAFKNI